MDDDLFREDEIQDVEDAVNPVERPSEGIPWGAVFLLIWAVLLIIFSVQNAEQTTVEFLGWSVVMPVALLVMITALVTLVLTGLGTAIYRRKRRRQRELRAKVRESGD